MLLLIRKLRRMALLRREKCRVSIGMLLREKGGAIFRTRCCLPSKRVMPESIMSAGRVDASEGCEA